MRIAKSLLCLSVLCLSALAQDWAKETLNKSPRHQEWIQIKRGDKVIHSFIVYPEVKHKAPVVIVIHEIFGVSDWVRTVADQLAANGYIAIVPDLLSGVDGKEKSSDFPDRDSIVNAIRKLQPDQVNADLNAVADYAKKIPAANGKIAVSGFCWGGGRTFDFARVRPDLGAAYVFYGPSPDDTSTIKAPVYGFYGENDARVNATIDVAKAAMAKAGQKFEPVIYKGAGHGFMRQGQDPNGPPADKQAREDAWKRWLELLKRL